MVAPRKPPGRMTVAEFIAWHPGKDDGRRQVVDGEPVLMAPASLMAPSRVNSAACWATIWSSAAARAG